MDNYTILVYSFINPETKRRVFRRVSLISDGPSKQIEFEARVGGFYRHEEAENVHPKIRALIEKMHSAIIGGASVEGGLLEVRQIIADEITGMTKDEGMKQLELKLKPKE